MAQYIYSNKSIDLLIALALNPTLSLARFAMAAENRMNLSALQQRDPYITDIVDTASQVALYSFNSKSNEWVRYLQFVILLGRNQLILAAIFTGWKTCDWIECKKAASSHDKVGCSAKLCLQVVWHFSNSTIVYNPETDYSIKWQPICKNEFVN